MSRSAGRNADLANIASGVGRDAERAKDVSLLKHVDQGLARKFHELKILTPAALLKAF